MAKDNNAPVSSGILALSVYQQRRSMSRFWVILTIVIVALGALFVATKPKESSNSTFSGDAKTVQEDDHVRGNRTAKVVLIEYGDLQCPACGSYYPILKELEEEFSENIAFVFRHFPLISIHPNAFSAARAAEAASKQGKFWEMHDRLFETQDVWGKVASNQQSLFEGYAEELSLNMDTFRTDFSGNAVADRINRDVASAKEFDVRSTPTFVLNGEKIENPGTIDSFRALLKDAVEKANGSSDSSKEATE